jgi:hypothetical protein
MEQQGYRNINGMFPYYTSYLIPGMLLYRVHDHPSLMTAQEGYAYAYVLDHHFLLNQHNINSVSTQTRHFEATRTRYNTNVDRNQPRMNASSSSAYAHVQDGHFILHENIGRVNRQVPTRRDNGATRRQHNTNVDRNHQPRVNTQDASSSATYAYYVQDGHFILHENIGQVNRQVQTRRRDIGGATHRRFDANLEKIVIQEVPINSEDMTCSICLAELSVGSEAIRLPSPCLHVYHENCILKWFDKSSTCPLCRRRVL